MQCYGDSDARFGFSAKSHVYRILLVTLLRCCGPIYSKSEKSEHTGIGWISDFR